MSRIKSFDSTPIKPEIVNNNLSQYSSERDALGDGGDEGRNVGCGILVWEGKIGDVVGCVDNEVGVADGVAVGLDVGSAVGVDVVTGAVGAAVTELTCTKYYSGYKGMDIII